MNNKPELAKELAVRQNAIDFFMIAGLYLPNPDPVLKRLGKDIQAYNDLLADPFLAGCVTSRKAGVMSLNWELSDQGANTDIISAVISALNPHRLFNDMLDAVLFGYSVLEVIWERQGGLILPSAVLAKPQHWFVFDEDNNLMLRTRDHFMGAPVPERKFILCTHVPTYINPYGQAVLSRCFWPCTFRKGGFRFWVQFTEKYGSPFIVGKHPRGAKTGEIDALADSLDNMIQDAVAVIPDDASVNILEAGGKGASADVFNKLIDACKTEISIAVLGQNLTTEVKGGSYAAAETHMRVRDEIMEADQRIIEDGVNTLIRWIWEINFQGDPPVFSFCEAAEDLKALAARDQMLYAAGARFTPAYWQRMYGMEPDDLDQAAISAQASPSPGGSGPQFAEQQQFTRDQQAIEELVAACLDRAGAVDAARIQRIMDAVNKAGSFAELSQMLPSLISSTQLPPTPLNEGGIKGGRVAGGSEVADILQKALVSAHLWGREQADREQQAKG